MVSGILGVGARYDELPIRWSFPCPTIDIQRMVNDKRVGDSF